MLISIKTNETREARRPCHGSSETSSPRLQTMRDPGCRCARLGLPPCPRDEKANSHICQIPHAWSSALLQHARSWGSAESAIDDQFWKGLGGSSRFVAENVAGIGPFWAKFFAQDALALQQALQTNLPAGANILDASYEQDAEDFSFIGPGAMDDLRWLAPGLTKPISATRNS